VVLDVEESEEECGAPVGVEVAYKLAYYVVFNVAPFVGFLEYFWFVVANPPDFGDDVFCCCHW